METGGRFANNYCSAGERLLVRGSNNYSFGMQTTIGSDANDYWSIVQTTIGIALYSLPLYTLHTHSDRYAILEKGGMQPEYLHFDAATQPWIS